MEETKNFLSRTMQHFPHGMTRIYESNDYFDLVPERNDMEEIQSLVKRVKKGDTDAFVTLYETVYQDMYAYACYMLRNPADAEDAVSETVMCAYETIGRLRDAGKFRNWIFKILSNQCRKKRKSYLREGEAVEMEVSGSPDPMKQTEEKRDLEAAFTVLNEGERYIVNGFVFAGYRGEEIANFLNSKPSTIRSKYRRALQKMRKYLEVSA